MIIPATSSQTLTDVDDSVLVVVDVQQAFLDKLEPEDQLPLVNRISWIVRIAATLGVPIVVTAEDIAELGTTVAAVADGFPDGTEQHNKMTFGLAGDPAIVAAVEQHGRRTAVIVGLETDVCVMQSALGLQQQGLRVVVLSDATASPSSMWPRLKCQSTSSRSPAHERSSVAAVNPDPVCHLRSIDEFLQTKSLHR